MAPVNKSVGWAARRLMDTNQLQDHEGHGPTLHPQSSNLRHTSQFPHHSTSNFCTPSGDITQNRMAPVNKSVGWASRRSMDTNQLHRLQEDGPTLHPKSSNLRHTSQFPHHSTSNFCTLSGDITENRMVPVKKSVGWAARRSMDTNELQDQEGHGPALHAQSLNLRHTSQFPHRSTSNV